MTGNTPPEPGRVQGQDYGEVDGAGSFGGLYTSLDAARTTGRRRPTPMTLTARTILS